MPNVLIVVKMGHLRRDCRQGFPRNHFSSGNGKIEGLKILDCVEDVKKINIGPMNEDQQKSEKASHMLSGNYLGGSFRPPCQTWSCHSQSL